ncbi:MAG: hypothetical protein L6R36_008431 [Xanthoria steineri]|nr:MAG: hypothetical protein L6R36_008431 [Xanthoria steineri]
MPTRKHQSPILIQPLLVPVPCVRKATTPPNPQRSSSPLAEPSIENVLYREAIAAAAETYHVDPDEEPNYLIRDFGTWPKPQNEEERTLRDVFERNEWDKEDGTKTTGQIHVRYEYHIGHGWGHTIILLGRAEKGLHQVLAGRQDNVPSILCSGGQGHPCAEDCGGQFGCEGLSNAFRRQKGDRSKTEWYKTVCVNGDPNGLGPYKWDILEVNEWLREVDVKTFQERCGQGQTIVQISRVRIGLEVVGSHPLHVKRACRTLHICTLVPLVKRHLLYRRSRSPSMQLSPSTLIDYL